MGHSEADRTLIPPQEWARRIALPLHPRHKAVLGYLCEQLLDLGHYRPLFSDSAIELLARCGSQLERMFLVGLAFSMDTRALLVGAERQRVETAGAGRWAFPNAWMAFRDQYGPTELHIRPQLPRAGLNFDFGVYFGGLLTMAVEVDGYNVHRHQRTWDKEKARRLTIPVVRLYEETDDPLRWAESILDWTRPPCDHCGEHIYRPHSCPVF